MATSATARIGAVKTPLSKAQVLGFWAAWGGWTLDGMDSFIHALVLALFGGMGVMIVVSFGVCFYLPTPLVPFLGSLFFLGFAGGNVALFSLWLPEQYETAVRATAFGFCTSVGRFVGAAINFGIAGMVRGMGTLGTPIALTAIGFGIGLLVIPFALETRGELLPD